jgi:predicted RNA-binding protein with PUA-like domain
MPRSERRYWLMKTEPDVYSIDDLAREEVGVWEGVRNYQARNSMREMRRGDLVLFYHSNAEPPGVVGVAEVHREAYPDPFQFDPKSKYFDPKSRQEEPRWSAVDLTLVEKFPRVVSLAELKATPALEGMEVVRKGSRLSVHPVSAAHFRAVLKMGGAKSKAG